MSVLIERALIVVGLSCLGWYGFAVADAASSEQEARAAVERALAAAPTEPAATDAPAPAAAPQPLPLPEPEPEPEPAATAKPEAEHKRDAVAVPEFASNVVGLLEIPRLRFSTPILEGDDSQTLKGAAGHLPDTPHPWELGNSAIAAHRDGIFRPLRRIRVGDELHVETPHGRVRYRVSDTHIVVPTDLSVLEAKTPHMLTLITCYPFNYIGSAPKRFIVHAERIME